MIFKIGDTVEWCGARGIIEYISGTLPGYIRVAFGQGGIIDFTIDGRFHYWHTEPSLILIKRPKKKVKKQIEMWAAVQTHTDGKICSYKAYATKEMAEISLININNDQFPLKNCVKLTGEYEVECDE